MNAEIGAPGSTAVKLLPPILSGIRVLDWTHFQQGPVATLLLADLGADVIKIESPRRGDGGRHFRSIGGAPGFHASGRNHYFEINNRNKRSIALDLSQPRGREVLHKLIERSDAFVHNFRQPVVRRLGLTWHDLRHLNPRLIYASCSGYGREGPDRDLPSFDLSAQARSGFMSTVGPAGAEPMASATGFTDQLGALVLAFGIVSALLSRERDGTGQEVHTSHLSSMTWLQGLTVSLRLMTGRGMDNIDRRNPINPLWNWYCCRDGRWIVVSDPPDSKWQAFCRATGLGEAAQYDTFEKRLANIQHLVELIDTTFATRTRDEWLRTLRAADVICSPVNTIDELIDDPQVRANGYLVTYQHPVLGDVDLVASPVQFSSTEATVPAPAPDLGIDTFAVLSEFGFASHEIEDLGVSGII
jgi:crotonobetainyl-CoA:carnitine CoA-transferase CaiB-like acyl-CoA transferase